MQNSLVKIFGMSVNFSFYCPRCQEMIALLFRALKNILKQQIEVVFMVIMLTKKIAATIVKL